MMASSISGHKNLTNCSPVKCETISCNYGVRGERDAQCIVAGPKAVERVVPTELLRFEKGK